MANLEQLNLLLQGVEVWNRWRERNGGVRPDLVGVTLDDAHLSGANLRNAHLYSAHLRNADLHEADLREVDLSGADLRNTDLRHADLREGHLQGADLRLADFSRANLGNARFDDADMRVTNLSDANLSGAHLRGAQLSDASLCRANLHEADLQRAILVQADFTQANLSGCHIFGISAWKLNLTDAIQSDLVITEDSESDITVDNLETAQFVYLLLHNEKLRDMIDTIGKKAVLILGRFTTERKSVLDALRDALRKCNYTPILFDFEKPSSRDLTETIVTLAHLSRFIIADITDAKSIPQELQAFVPNLPSVAVQPLIYAADYEYAMFEHFRRYPWVLPVYRYETPDQLLSTLFDEIIQPAENKVRELRGNL